MSGLNLVPVHHCFSSTHKTESIYRRYAIVSEADLKEGVTKLAWLHKSQGVPASPTVIRFQTVGGPQLGQSIAFRAEGLWVVLRGQSRPGAWPPRGRGAESRVWPPRFGV